MSSDVKKFTILSALLILTIGIIIGLVLFPAILSINDHKIAIAKSEGELANLQQKYDSLKKINRRSDTQGMISKLGTLWPQDKEVSSFIIQLENLAQSENLTFDNLSISEINKPKAKNSAAPKGTNIQFSFSTSGPYSNIYSVIKKLENFDRFNTVTALSINLKDQQSVSMQLTGLTYYGD